MTNERKSLVEMYLDITRKEAQMIAIPRSREEAINEMKEKFRIALDTFNGQPHVAPDLVLMYMRLIISDVYAQVGRQLPNREQEDYEWNGCPAEGRWLCYDINSDGYLIRWHYNHDGLLGFSSQPIDYIQCTFTVGSPTTEEEEQAIDQAMKDPDGWIY
jgi:hypothetical protein